MRETRVGDLGHAQKVMAARGRRRAVVPTSLDDGVWASGILSAAEHGLGPHDVIEPDVPSHTERLEAARQRRAAADSLLTRMFHQ